MAVSTTFKYLPLIDVYGSVWLRCRRENILRPFVAGRKTTYTAALIFLSTANA